MDKSYSADLGSHTGTATMIVAGQPEAQPQFVLTHEGELLGKDTPENREIVRRIHACVAACEGLSTNELEAGIVADMRRVIGQVAPVLENKVRRAS